MLINTFFFFFFDLACCEMLKFANKASSSASVDTRRVAGQPTKQESEMHEKIKQKLCPLTSTLYCVRFYIKWDKNMGWQMIRSGHH